MKKKLTIAFIISIILLCGCSNNVNSNQGGSDKDMMSNKIALVINNKEFSATLEDNETESSFYNLLPLNINMSELNGNEYYHYLSGSLPSKQENVGIINKGDIMLYGNDCIVLFYKTFNTSYSYTKIGHLDDVSALDDVIGNNSIDVMINK